MITKPALDQILLVEDSPTDRLMTLEAFERYSLRDAVKVVEDGEQAMAYLRKEGRYHNAQRPRMILLDLNLPRKDGREVLAEVKADPELRAIPVVVLTTSAAGQDVADAYLEHANSYITKPVDFAEFTKTIGELSKYWLEVVTLPPGNAQTSPPAATPTPVGIPNPLSILVLEDNPVDVLFLQDALSLDAGDTMKFDVVTRAAELSGALRREHYDAIITDLGLPDSNGIETYRRVRTQAPHLPIIVLTGLADDHLGEKALQEGAEEYLIKDELTPRSLARAIRYAMERRATQERMFLTQRNEAIGQLAGGIAHDFNNLLTIIAGHCSELSSGDLTAPEGLLAREEILAATSRAATLTKQLLTFSRRQALDIRRLDLNQVIRAFSSLLDRLLGERILLSVELCPEPLWSHGDESMLNQMLLSLAINARDAMPDGGTLHISARSVALGPETPTDSRNNYACLVISDTGRGVAPENLERVFEAYYTTKEVGQGTGLGLATVRSIVSQHGGKVSVKSQLGRGTSFEVFLPLAQDQGPAEKFSGISPPVEDSRSDRRSTILVVEDDSVIRTLAARLLQKRGYQVLCADDGEHGLRLFEENQQSIDLVFTDLRMPRMDGREMAERIARLAPSLPIIYTSGYSVDLHSPDFRPVPGHSFLAKPYEVAQLTQLVAQRLADRQDRSADIFPSFGAGCGPLPP